MSASCRVHFHSTPRCSVLRRKCQAFTLAVSVLIWHMSIKALLVKNADFNFSHVEPTGMFRRAMKVDVSQQGIGLLNSEHVLETLAKVGVEVVHYQMGTSRRGVNLRERVLYERREVSLGAMISDHDRRPPPPFWLDRYEQVARASAVIFVILLCERTGLDWQGRTRILEQLLALLVQTNDWFLRMVRMSIKVEQVVHSLPIFFSKSANAPHHLAPRLEAVFISRRRIVSRLIEPMSGCFCAACSSNSSVQCWAPSGGLEQANALICASTSVSCPRGLPMNVRHRTPRMRYPPQKCASCPPDGCSPNPKNFHEL